MATPLRYALIFLLWAMIAVIYAPLIPAALTLISPALSLTHWQALFADPQLRETLQSRMPQDLPPVLAEPHAGWVHALEQEWLHRYGTH